MAKSIKQVQSTADVQSVVSVLLMFERSQCRTFLYRL